MSTFVYLAERLIEQATHEAPSLFTFHHGRIRVERDEDGRLYFRVKNEYAPPNSRIPEVLRPYVESISLRREFSNNPRRTTGVYRHGTAEAALDSHPKDKNWVVITVQGDNVCDVDSLYHQVRAGSISPEESWETEQTGTMARSAVPPRPRPSAQARGELPALSQGEPGQVLAFPSRQPPPDEPAC